MQWGYLTGDRITTPVPLTLPVSSHCHALITGSSGSGKSYALLYLVGRLLQDIPDIKVTFCDFKNSDDFEFMKGYPHYYSGNESYDGIMAYYSDFCKDRIQGKPEKRHILIVDEYPALINYLTTLDKQNKTKKAGDILSAVAEILMLGRGIGYGFWCVTQRADSSLFSNVSTGGARDNFMVILGLGRMSREQKGMVFTGEDLPDKVYRQGEGCLLADGYPLREVAYPRISNPVDWKKHIMEQLMTNSE